MSKINEIIKKGLIVILIGLLCLLLIAVLWQVFSRFILHSPSSFTDELSRFLLIWLSFLGSAYLVTIQEHIAITILSDKFNRKIYVILKYAIILIFSVLVLVIGGISLVSTMLEMNQLSSALQLPVGLVYTVLPISGILISIFCLNNISQAWKGDKA
jgi:TRAP-type C4-dicarboxylate transport system permease small subunit